MSQLFCTATRAREDPHGARSSKQQLKAEKTGNKKSNRKTHKLQRFYNSTSVPQNIAHEMRIQQYKLMQPCRKQRQSPQVKRDEVSETTGPKL